jgi:hypothetical protein
MKGELRFDPGGAGTDDRFSLDHFLGVMDGIGGAGALLAKCLALILSSPSDSHLLQMP